MGPADATDTQAPRDAQVARNLRDVTGSCALLVHQIATDPAWLLAHLDESEIRASLEAQGLTYKLTEFGL